MNNQLTQLPEGWVMKSLGDVLKLEYGKPLPAERRVNNGKYPVYGANGQIGRSDEFYFDKKSIVVGRKGSAGEINLTEKKFWPLDVTYYVEFNDRKFDLKFLYYLLSGMELPKLAKGVKPGINRNEVYNLKALFPCLSEQHRIVSILDKAFAAIDKAKAIAEQTLQNAKELFESELQRILEQKGEGWEEKKLGDTCIVERGSSPRPIKEYQTESQDGVNWIKIGDTKSVDKYIYTTKEKITKKGAEKSRYVKEGDFILSNSMSFGKPYIMKTDGYIHDGWFVFRLPPYLNKDFFYYLLISSNVQKQIQSLGAGAIVKNISGDLVKKVDIFFPKSNIDQQLIVQQLDVLKTKTLQLQSIYQHKIAALDELKKSLLQKALTGKLTIEKEANA